MKRFFSLGALILLFCSCSQRHSTITTSLSDTSKVLQIAILMGIDIKFMPDAGSLKGKLRFADTVLLTSQALPLELLPKALGDQQFKIRPQTEICTILDQEQSFPSPKYLKVQTLEKSDSGYYVQMQSISCRRYPSGGSLGLYFKKYGDSFLVVKHMSSSIN